MAAATVVIHNFPSDGTLIAIGTATSVADNDTIDTGLPVASGMLMTTATDDCVASFTSQSAGVATISLQTAGVSATGITVYWIAWCTTNNG